MKSFYEILEESSELTLDEQESFVEILQKRISDEKRKIIVNEVREATIEFNKGNKNVSSIQDILDEINE